jgi:murein L,D-transpeptidase YcbB/YkuD
LQALVESRSLDAATALAKTTPAEQRQLGDQVQRFYKDHGYRLIWFDGDSPSRRYRQLQQAVHAAEHHGLPAHLYKLPLDTPSRDRITAEEAPALDVRATAAFFRYFQHLTSGRLDPRAIQSLWTLRPEKPDLVAALGEAIAHDNLPEAMARLQPPQAEYQELQKALVRYRAIAEKGGWPALPATLRLKPGGHSDALPLVRKRLALEGDLDAQHENSAGTSYDDITVAAVRRFEERHRLKPDGIIDVETLAAMNTPVEQRIRAIELNMERWRWLPDRLPSRSLVVNVPDFRLEVIENQRPVLDMRVVVGAPDNKTPIFADEMTHVVFSPYWNVPPNIAREETIPRALRDPGFIMRNNMEVVAPTGQVVDPDSVDWSNAAGLRIRQRPGSGNALGGVKFMFPNNFDVYLHDTNASALFDRLERGLSHGCVRVEEPERLAQYVLRDQPEWTPEAVRAAMTSGREQHVKLKSPIPVYILYKTAWVHDGGVRFLKDIYGHDAQQSAKLWP